MTRFFAPLPVLALLAQLLFPQPAVATEFFVFPVKVKVPVRMVELATDPDVVVERKLTEKDIVNLALGRPLGTKIDKSKEVLAIMAARYSSDAEEGKLVVLDPSKNGLAQITTTVAVPTMPDGENAILPKGGQGHGTATGQVQETTLGDPSKNALHASTIWVSGGGTGNSDNKVSIKGIVAGRLSLTITENGQTKSFAGFIVNGKGAITGKPISLLDDGDDEGCGDGIVQTGLGEECEFNHQEACPGDCDACRCVTCGDGNIDPGEICDTPALGVCAELDTFCKPDCSGCTYCGDGFISPAEDCDTLGADAACPGQCHPVTCQCPG